MQTPAFILPQYDFLIIYNIVWTGDHDIYLYIMQGYNKQLIS